ncbi:hypothetical protein AMTR_s00012p00090500 [Amborella trichopoda]|uniref:Uncharacterized protein n=1 Tax=Amborella trichopoda TaxID=13333 RepID=W1PJC8_AMBTC|nr:hypothetical protein AMTR_s00012p00090500 [Amborella trichopoda]
MLLVGAGKGSASKVFFTSSATDLKGLNISGSDSSKEPGASVAVCSGSKETATRESVCKSSTAGTSFFREQGAKSVNSTGSTSCNGMGNREGNDLQLACITNT